MKVFAPVFGLFDRQFRALWWQQWLSIIEINYCCKAVLSFSLLEILKTMNILCLHLLNLIYYLYKQSLSKDHTYIGLNIDNFGSFQIFKESLNLTLSNYFLFCFINKIFVFFLIFCRISHPADDFSSYQKYNF